MSTTTKPAKTADLRQALEAKNAEIDDTNAKLGELRGKLGRAAIEGGDTRAIREGIREAEDQLWDLGAQQQHLDQRLAEARETERQRWLNARLAERYHLDVKYLQTRAEVLRLQLEAQAAEEALDRSVAAAAESAGAGSVTSFHQFRDWSTKQMRGEGIEVASMGGLFDVGGGWTSVEEILADLERFEQFAEAAEEASR